MSWRFASLFALATACLPDPWLSAMGEAELIASEAQRTGGDAMRGREALVSGDYIGVGIPLGGYLAAMPPLEAKDRLPERTGNNALVPYSHNVVVNPRGMELVSPNCLSCHASHLKGQLVIGLGNPDPVGNRASGVPTNPASVRGALKSDAERDEFDTHFKRTLAAIEAGPLSSFSNYAAHRDVTTLAWSNGAKFDAATGLRGIVDPPPLWRVKKKSGLYANGMGRGDHVGHFMNMTTFSVDSVAEAERLEPMFVDIAAFLRSLEPPKYPGAIETSLAVAGQQVFNATCAQCHGTYGAGGAYPNRLTPVAEVGTDPELALRSWVDDEVVRWFNASFYGRHARLEPKAGYVAPPLDGIWATAPFLHNGSVPTLFALLDSSKRPTRWHTNFEDDDYDLEALGWRNAPDGRVYDCEALGQSNQGHTFGDALSTDERRAVIEYLKTL